MSITVEQRDRFERYAKFDSRSVSFEELNQLIEKCDHPLDVTSLKEIQQGKPGNYFVTDQEHEYRIQIERLN